MWGLSATVCICRCVRCRFVGMGGTCALDVCEYEWYCVLL